MLERLYRLTFRLRWQDTPGGGEIAHHRIGKVVIVPCQGDRFSYVIYQAGFPWPPIYVSSVSYASREAARRDAERIVFDLSRRSNA